MRPRAQCQASTASAESGDAVSCVLMAIAAFGGRRPTQASARPWALALVGALGIGVCAALQRYWVYARVDDNLWDRRITYPITPPVKELDALLVRWQLVDLAMVLAGVIVVYAASREFLATAPPPIDNQLAQTRPG
jgi:hypothetical protein